MSHQARSTKRFPVGPLMDRPSVAIAVVVLSAVGIGLLGWLLPANVNIGDGRLWAWILSIPLLAVALLVLGWCMKGRWYGVLIDERNKASLSRLQLLLWTIVIIPGIAIAGLANWVTSGSDALGFTIPQTVLAVLGISLGVTAGTPLIVSVKQTVNPPRDPSTGQSPAAAAAAPAQPSPTVSAALVTLAQHGVLGAANRGMVLVKASSDQAQLLDLFRGDDVTNGAYVDISKVQMFYITLVLVGIYALMLGALLSGQSNKITSMPDFNVGMVTLLAISHAGYLTYKAIPHAAAPPP